jgi:hypothetical protein
MGNAGSSRREWGRQRANGARIGARYLYTATVIRRLSGDAHQ